MARQPSTAAMLSICESIVFVRRTLPEYCQFVQLPKFVRVQTSRLNWIMKNTVVAGIVFRIYNAIGPRKVNSIAQGAGVVCTLQSNQRWCRIMKCQWVSNSIVFFLQQFSVVFVDTCSCLGPNAPPHLYDVEVGLHFAEQPDLFVPEIDADIVQGNFHWKMSFSFVVYMQGLLVLPALLCCFMFHRGVEVVEGPAVWNCRFLGINVERYAAGENR